MKHDQIYFDDIIKLILHSKYKIIATVVITTTIFMAASFVIPKKFKSTAVINVYTKYFKNPLVGQVIAELQNTDEMKNNLQSLISQAVDDEFVDQVAEKYNLYTNDPGKVKRNTEREFLRERFQVMALGHQSFQVAFIYSDPIVAKEIASLTMHRVIDGLVKHRSIMIENIKDSIRKRIEVMAMSQDSVTNPLASTKPEVLSRQLVSIRAEIEALKSQYSENHPSVKALKQKEQIVNKWLNVIKSGKEIEDPTLKEKDQFPVIGGDSKYALTEINKDLLTKYNYLNIISELENVSMPDYIGIVQHPQIPASPIFPNKMLFTVFGLLIGIVLSALIIVMEEFLLGKGIGVHEKVAKGLGVPYLGKLPYLNIDSLSHQIELKTQNQSKNKKREITQ
jgi:LPS O-antigen subunit length determinant protein (WzzB/FepE family)